MPSKNTIKQYVENGVYHLYNRGVNKQLIFFEESDYKYFLYLLKTCLIETSKVKKIIGVNNRSAYTPKNFHRQVEILCFCLMPNHFHLLVKQTTPRLIESFMRSLLTRYAKYINIKQNRVGHLFQGRYRGVIIMSDELLLHISKYIHLNPAKLSPKLIKFKQAWYDYQDYPFSSYQWYLNNYKNEWFNPKIILTYFTTKAIFIPRETLSYQHFMSTSEKSYPKSLDTAILESNEDSPLT